MNVSESKSYKIPTQSIPGLEISVHINDLQEIIKFFENRGISTKNTRLYRYLDYLIERSHFESLDESQIFKNSNEKVALIGIFTLCVKSTNLCGFSKGLKNIYQKV